MGSTEAYKVECEYSIFDEGCPVPFSIMKEVENNSQDRMCPACEKRVLVHTDNWDAEDAEIEEGTCVALVEPTRDTSEALLGVVREHPRKTSQKSYAMLLGWIERCIDRRENLIGALATLENMKLRWCTDETIDRISQFKEQIAALQR